MVIIFDAQPCERTPCQRSPQVSVGPLAGPTAFYDPDTAKRRETSTTLAAGIYRHVGMANEWSYAALAVLDTVPSVPGRMIALPTLSSFDPIDPPDTLYPLFADSPWWSGREMLADLLLTLPHWGYTRVRWVTTDAHTPLQIARDKTVLYCQGPDLPTVVVQIFWEPQMVGNHV